MKQIHEKYWEADYVATPGRSLLLFLSANIIIGLEQNSLDNCDYLNIYIGEQSFLWRLPHEPILFIIK